MSNRFLFFKSNNYFFLFYNLTSGNLAKSQRIKFKGRYQVPGFRPRTNDNSRETSQQSRDTTLRYTTNSRRVIIGAEVMSGSTATAHPHSNSFRSIGRPLVQATKSSDDSFRTAPLHGPSAVSGKREPHRHESIDEGAELGAFINNNTEFGTQDDGDIQFTMLSSTRELPLSPETEILVNNTVENEAE